MENGALSDIALPPIEQARLDFAHFVPPNPQMLTLPTERILRCFMNSKVSLIEAEVHDSVEAFLSLRELRASYWRGSCSPFGRSP